MGATFSHEGATGPEHWGQLDPAWSLADTGRSQSPVDLPDMEAELGPALWFDYQESPLRIVNDGHAVQVNYAPGSELSVDGGRFHLEQFHFHIPGEHTIAGRAGAMEAHLVHTSAGGELAVLGVLIMPGTENPFLARFWDRLPAEPGPEQRHDDVTVNVADLLPVDHTTYRYSGSLTMPPCTEGVDWFVLRAPVQASEAQIARLHGITGDNARPLQDLHGREVRLVR